MFLKPQSVQIIFSPEQTTSYLLDTSLNWLMILSLCHFLAGKSLNMAWLWRFKLVPRIFFNMTETKDICVDHTDWPVVTNDQTAELVSEYNYTFTFRTETQNVVMSWCPLHTVNHFLVKCKSHTQKLTRSYIKPTLCLHEVMDRSDVVCACKDKCSFNRSPQAVWAESASGHKVELIHFACTEAGNTIVSLKPGGGGESAAVELVERDSCSNRLFVTRQADVTMRRMDITQQELLRPWRFKNIKSDDLEQITQ